MNDIDFKHNKLCNIINADFNDINLLYLTLSFTRKKLNEKLANGEQSLYNKLKIKELIQKIDDTLKILENAINTTSSTAMGVYEEILKDL